MGCLRRIALALSIAWALTAIGCTAEAPDGTASDAGESISDAETRRPSFDTTAGPSRPNNTAPTGTITSPSEGQVVQQGDPVSFAAVVGDAESPRNTLTVTWLSNLSGVLHEETVNEAGSTTFERSDLAAGTHIVTLVVTDEGGLATDVTRTFSVNGPPSQAQVSIEPAEPKTGDDLHATIVNDASDPNRAATELTYRYTWYRGEELKQTSSTVLANQTAKGEVWRVEVRANDGMVDGLAASVEVTIGNSAPSCESAIILPAAGKTNEDFTCACAGRDDPDDDSDEDTCIFSDGGVKIADGCTLPADMTTKDMVLTCTVSPDDGEDAGEPVTSVEAPVLNSPPTTPEAALSPIEGTVDTLFTCEVGADSTDLDGDPITYRYTWTVNGYANPGTSSSSALASSLISDAEGTLAGGGDQIFCSVQGDDNAGGLSNPATSQVVVLQNSPPSGGAVVISPPSGTEADIFTCVATEAQDPDGDLLLWSYVWLIEGEDGVATPIPGAASEAITGAFFDRGDLLTCVATPTDGIGSGEPVESKNKVTVANSLPQLEGATLDPALVDAQGAFSCTPYGWSDLDGDPEEVAFAWLTVTGDTAVLMPGKVEPTLPAALLAPGEIIRCQVTPKNGNDLGQPVQSGDGQVMNDPPTLATATLTPEEPTVDATLLCAPSGYADLEGGGPEYIYAWQRNNEDILGAQGSTLSEGFAKGDRIRCIITPNDGIENGQAVPSNEVEILNTIPTIGSLTLTPDFTTPCETLSCEISDVVEPDLADSLTYAYRWELNGSPIPPVTKTLAAAAYSPNDTLRCHAKPTDGSFKDLPNGGITTVWGPEVSSNLATVINTPPTVASVSLGPPSPKVGDIVTCSPAGFEDAECTPTEAYTFIWYLNGEVIDGASDTTLALDFVDTGAKIQCQAIPDDGYTLGSGKLSAIITVINAPPTPAVVVIDAPEGNDGPITCAFQLEPTDIDPLSYTWFWQVNDQPEVVGEQVLTEGLTSDCDIVHCRVEVSDGLETLSSNVASLNLPAGDDCDDSNPCTSYGCLPEGGCVNSPNAAECDDGDPCTLNDTCSEGSCAGMADDCDDGNLCTTDSCNPVSGCTHSYNPSVCDDGNPCTADACDLALGVCTNEVLEDGTSCDGDGNGCTEGDSCLSGACIVGPAVDCPGEPDVCQHQVCESLSPHAHVCQTIYSAEDVSCEDGLQCTTGDHCNGSGTCVPGAFLDCSAGAGPCQIGSCVEGDGCVFVDAPNGSSCEADGDGCTQGDACSEGLCLPGGLVDCNLETDGCKVGFCESTSATTYSCSFVPTLAGTPCETGDFCYIDAACDGEGSCDGGSPRDCVAEVGYSCHTAYCDSSAELCIPIKAADGAGCDDGNVCTVTDACVNGYCQGSGDACREERLSVAVSGSSKPDVANLGYGRYVVQWAGDPSEDGGKVYDYIRLSDAYGSREDEERNVAGDVLGDASQSLTQFSTPTAVAPNGSFLTTSWTANGCSCSGYTGCTCAGVNLVARAYDYLGEPIAQNEALESYDFVLTGNSADTFSGSFEMTGADIETLAFPDGTWGLFKTDTITAEANALWTPSSTRGIEYTPLSANLIAGMPVELVERAELSVKRQFDVVALPDSDDFIVVWIHAHYKLGLPKWDRFYLQRFSTLGIPVSDPVMFYENLYPDAHDTDSFEVRYVEATGELLVAWDDQQGTGLRRARWLWVSTDGVMSDPETYTANDNGIGNQRLGDLEVFSDGGFVMTWDDDAGDVDGYSTKGRLFEVDGSPTSDQLNLNREGVGDQRTPSVAVLEGDDWVTAFADDAGRVWTRRFNREGAHVVGRLERTMNATTSGAQEELRGAQGADDAVFVVWTSPFAGNSGSEIVGRTLSPEGAPISAEAQLNTTMSGSQLAPDVTATPAGWMAVWQSEDQGALGSEVMGRLVSSQGTPIGAEFTIPTHTDQDQAHPTIASTGEALVVLWETGGFSKTIVGRLLDLEGQALGDEFSVTEEVGHVKAPQIAALPDGSGYLAIWERHWGVDKNVILRRLDAQGNPVGEPLIAHSATNLDQEKATLAIGKSGYAIVCVTTTTDGGATSLGIGCQRITTESLELIGPELVPHQIGSGHAHPALAYLSDGSWVVAWDSAEIDGDGRAVQLQRYNAFGIEMGQRIMANRTLEGDQWAPVLLPLVGPTSSFVVGWRQGVDEETDLSYRVLPGQ